jgi:hypothetical protein
MKATRCGFGFVRNTACRLRPGWIGEYRFALQANRAGHGCQPVDRQISGGEWLRTKKRAVKRSLLAAFGIAILLFPCAGLPSAGVQPEPLAAIVDGANKGKSVSIKLHPALAGRAIARLKQGIAEQYGVNLQIAYVPSSSYPQAPAKAIFEQSAGAPPSFDLLPFDDVNLAQAIAASLAEKVDWMTLIAPGTPPKVAHSNGYAISTHMNHIGLAYNLARGRPPSSESL